jgi:hypothetical protein
MLLAALQGAQAEAPPVAQVETAYLIAFVEASGCVFYRNGSAYDSVQAASHLREKFAAVSAAGSVRSAELFIDKVASRSSLTGLPYAVSCAGSERRAAADWLREALARFRARGASRELHDAP